MAPRRYLKTLSLTTALAIGLVGLLGASALQAQEQYRLRGTLVGIEADKIIFMNDDEETFELARSPEMGVFVVTPGSLADISEGQFVGMVSVESRGTRTALEVHIFDEDLRGIGEGHYEWDLIKDPNMMTNATVAEIQNVANNRQLTLTYKEGEGEAKAEATQTITVPSFADVVHMAKAPDPAAALAPDKPVFLIVEKGADGREIAVAAVIGSEGATPPM
jgi:hypothetical protein